MRISHRYNFIFFANPKTGSGTVRRFLDPYTDFRPNGGHRKVTAQNPFHNHMSPAQARPLFKKFDWDFEAYTKFCFVRNPWARLVSFYNHERRNWLLAADARIPEFKDWVYQVKPNGIGGGQLSDWQRYSSYSIEHFIKDQRGNILVDKVMRLENINVALKPFLARLGVTDAVTKDIGHSNRSADDGDYTTYYNADLIRHVEKMYRYDIAIFGYEFGS